MKSLNGIDLAGYIKHRQASQVRALIQSKHIQPRLAIIQTKDDPTITTYVSLKKAYGKDIQIDVDVYNISQQAIHHTINTLNKDESVHGIIVQLPLQDNSEADTILNQVEPKKDVDALGANAIFDPATPTAINWLLAGYNVELKNKKLTIVGNGRLVGAPLGNIWRRSGYEVTTLDTSTTSLGDQLKKSDIIVTATGTPGLITTDMIPPDCVLVDAGTASENGKTVGDVAEEVYKRNDIVMTPRKGGVGPLTVAALFENVIRAASEAAQSA